MKHIPDPANRVTIYDIAKKANVSIATVSRVLNGSGSVSKKSLDRVQRAIDEFNYIPSPLARGMSGQSIGMVGILVPVISDVNHAKIVSELEARLFLRGYSSLIVCNNLLEHKRNRNLYLLESKRVDAIIAVGSFVDDLEGAVHFENVRQKVPIVMVNGRVNAPDIPCVYGDECGIVRELTEELITKGHKTVLYVNDSTTYAGMQKLKGFREALESAGSEAKGIEVFVDQGEDNIEAASEAVERLIREGVAFSAVMSADDSLAIGALKAAARHGLSLPVIGYNNTRYARCSMPELSSIDGDFSQMCEKAVEMLSLMLAGEPAPGNVKIQARFVQRETYRR